MKKILIGLSLLISFAFACDSPYEEIQGVKIGCELADKDRFTKEDVVSLGDSYYSTDKGVKFFDSMEVETDENDKVIGVAFIKSYPITLSNMKLQEEQVISDYKQFAESLENRWGTFDKSKAKGIFSRLNLSGTLFMRDIKETSENNNPKSEALGKIMIMLNFNTDDKEMMRGNSQEAIFAIAYLGKSTAEEMQKEKESITDGF